MFNKVLESLNRVLGQITEGTDNMLTNLAALAMNVVNVGIRFALLMLLYQLVAADLPTVLNGLFE
tara:strand:- start:1098 stop:1292 length:195 start_codon:yes stop_codon:yes gene_type:complete